MQADSNLKVDGDRLWGGLMEMAKIGATPKGGVNRLTLRSRWQRGAARRVGTR